ncbi:MAG TPA: helix-turn-helix transcriptional regulator [Gemmatimonadales bacterium]|nr:helix-turn-helix transcriptional regulator [Gemmatimonadales bacterium]
MDVALVIRQRLDELQLEQRDLARAANVTESYVSQILGRKKAPPAPERTDIYDRMDRFLKLPPGELARVAEAHLKEERMRRLGEVAPLFPELRALLLRKCAPAERETVRAIIERQSFGELERLVAQTLLHVARLGGDIMQVTPKHRSRLDGAIAAWDWDPASFALTVRTTAGEQKRFEYSERGGSDEPEKGLLEFLRDPLLSGKATAGELAFLKSLRFKDRRPTALYYYRELQNLRDPLHFRAQAT